MPANHPSRTSESDASEDLRSTIREHISAIETKLPSPEDYGLSGPPKSMLGEAKALAGAVAPDEHGEQAKLLYVRAQLLERLGRHDTARFEGVQCVTAATRAFFGSATSDFWLQLHWRRVHYLGENDEWLACERALSELIGSLRTSSRPERVAACRRALALRGHLLQFRGLACHEADAARALLAAGLRDLEEVADDIGDQAVAQAERRTAQAEERASGATTSHSASPTDPRATDSASMGAPPGDVAAIRSRFRQGLTSTAGSFLVPQRNPLGILLMIAFFFGLAIALLTGLWNLPWAGSLTRLLTAIPLFALVAATVRILRDLGNWKRNRRAGLETFGLFLDQHRLAVHTVDAFSNNTYFYGRNGAWIPLERIRAILVRREPIYAMAGRMVKADVLVVRFEDEQGELQSITLRDTFEKKVRRIRDLFRVWSADLLGDWQEERGDGTLCFEPDRCTFTDGEGRTIEFNWRELPGGALELESVEPSSDGSKRLLHFELDASESRLDLRLCEGLDHPSGRSFHRSTPEHVSTLAPDRLAYRLEALREPRPLVP